MISISTFSKIKQLLIVKSVAKVIIIPEKKL